MRQQSLYGSLKNKGCSMLLTLHEWMQNRPLILSFLLSSSCILFSFLLVFCGDEIPSPFTLTKYDKNGHIRVTVFGFITSIACILWTFMLQAAEKYYQYKSEPNAEAANYIKKRVDKRIVNVCNNKYNTLISLIHQIVLGDKTPKSIISKPCEQLKTITREMADCLRTLLEHGGYTLDENEMYVSIFYKFHTMNEWKQTRSAFPETGLSVSDVTENPNSTFSHVLQNKNGVVFINNKQKGVDNNQYIPDKDDKYDDKNKLRGSILCYRIVCSKDGVNYIKAVLSISTYEKRIEPSNSSAKIKNTQDNICKYIIQAFEARIKIELCLLYLSELYECSRKDRVKSPKIQNSNRNK